MFIDKVNNWIASKSDDVIIWLVILVLSVWGGVLNVLKAYRKEGKFKLVESFGEVSASALCGILTGLFAFNTLPLYVVVGLAGIAGHMGSRALFMMEFWIQRKLGISEEDIAKQIKQQGD